MKKRKLKRVLDEKPSVSPQRTTRKNATSRYLKRLLRYGQTRKA